MIFDEVEHYMKVFQLSNFHGHNTIETIADKVISRYLPLLMWVSCLLLGSNLFVYSPLNCFLSSSVNSLKLFSYVRSYCWTHGTLVLPNNTIPVDKSWNYYENNYRITYYQWGVFVIGILSVTLYLPRLLWQVWERRVAGFSMERLLREVSAMPDMNPEFYNEFVVDISLSLDATFRPSQQADAKPSQSIDNCIIRCLRLPRRMLSKLWEKQLIIVFVLMKVLYIVICGVHILLLVRFLGLGHDIFFGYNIFKDLLQGVDWRQSHVFPRVTFCHVDGIRVLGNTQRLIAQCVLPVNMIAEKVYILLWFVYAIGIVIEAISIPMTINQFSRRYRREFLLKYTPTDCCWGDCELQSQSEAILRYFRKYYITNDGVLILRYIRSACNDGNFRAIMMELFELYGRVHFQKDANKRLRATEDVYDWPDSISVRLDPDYHA